HGTNDPGLPGPTPAGVVNTTATDGTRPPTLLNDTGNVTQTLASLARNAGETVTAPGPTYAITSGVLNALGGSAAGNYSTSGALSVANSRSEERRVGKERGTRTTPGQTKEKGKNDPALPGLTLAGVVNTTVTDWNGTPTPSSGPHTMCLSDWSSDVCSSDLVTAPGPTYAITSGVLNALGGSAAGNYSTSGALSVANS